MSHPAHFHLFKNVIPLLEDDGHRVYVAIKTKDVLEDLVIKAGYSYYNLMPKPHRGSRFGIAFDLLVRDIRLSAYVLRKRIDLLTGSTPEVAHVSWLLRRKSVNLGEDDLSAVPSFGKAVGGTLQCMLAPDSCDTGRFEDRTVHYAGFQKLAYLHPCRFTPDRAVVRKYFSPDTPYFILRFAKLRAYHDIDKAVHGIDTEVASRMISLLLPHGRVFISSERPLEPQFEQYRLNIDPSDMHHVLAFASMYIGDSQSMAVEAAMLGVPGLRMNDFVGKIGVLRELDERYSLSFGVSPANPEILLEKIAEYLFVPDLRGVFLKRRDAMLADKVDVAAFIAGFIGNYHAMNK